ncbi:hypothetical protein LTR36_002541 [Oleoguttula mirabilis]|uniref:CST complex subunit Stn1 N-terminal domain-containing protein n=1 Tax=Oleoguttula mirabilis TaxID=1507867 RepID=A0AAV9JLU5_9PEZI|nr:hypothetical protein LTR36_002541 [Oleoguttula mirabilis]
MGEAKPQNVKRPIAPVPPPPQIYPRRYFEASPTWFAWNKLTAADIHALRTERGFEGQKIYFHLNHPIQFVTVVGLLVEIEGIADGKYTLLTLDDGSGECMVVKVRRRVLAKGDEAEYPSNTEVDNVDVHVNLALPAVFLDNKPVGLGDVIKAKGTIDSFRGVRQLDLKRMFTVKDTNAEAQAWSQTAQWKRETLSQPWILTQSERDTVDENIRQEEKKDRERARRKKEWNAKISDKRRRHDEKQEIKRREKEAKYNDGALKGSHIILAPWE